jgi:hypothetical protein
MAGLVRKVDAMEVNGELSSSPTTSVDSTAAALRNRGTDTHTAREDLDDAERTHDETRASPLQAELDAIADELQHGARGRRAASHSERARVAVTKGIKTALAKIRAGHPALARHLEATVKRGYSCAYVPDPRHPIEWLR